MPVEVHCKIGVTTLSAEHLSLLNSLNLPPLISTLREDSNTDPWDNLTGC